MLTAATVGATIVAAYAASARAAGRAALRGMSPARTAADGDAWAAVAPPLAAALFATALLGAVGTGAPGAAPYWYAAALYAATVACVAAGYGWSAWQARKAGW